MPDLWTQLRDARKRDEHEDKLKTQELRSARDREKASELPHPVCCELAHRLIFPYRRIDIHTETVLNGGVPIWRMGFNTTWEGGMREVHEIHFCPFCGKKLPKFRKKVTPPKHIAVEGDFRCQGCGERYGGYCFCSHPESAYEIER